MSSASDPLRITSTETTASEEDRFHRFRLIGWWDQKKLADAHVLVVGAGALGNEIVKNLALLGVGQILVADMDRIENSNLSRSILYRAADNGRYKAEVAAQSAREIYPDLRIDSFIGNITYDMGLGVYRWADLVIGGLDNREARLSINRACYKFNKPWIDGAIEQIQGTARVFVPDSPCYECTMSENDWKLLQMRRSCNLLTRSQMQQGKVPTTPTISSIIAGVQCQEAVKILHGLPSLAGQGWVFTGLSADSYIVNFQRNPDCLSHDPLAKVMSLDQSVDEITVRQLLALARAELGPDAWLELARDTLESFVCPSCHRQEYIFASLGKISADRAICPHCPGVQRDVRTFYRIDGSESFLDQMLGSIGVPPFDVITARAGNRAVGFELSGDASRVLGLLHDASEALQWE